MESNDAASKAADVNDSNDSGDAASTVRTPTTTTLETILQTDVFAKEIFAHLPHCYRFVAGVNRSLRDAYRKATADSVVVDKTSTVTTTTTRLENALASPRTTAILMAETAGNNTRQCWYHWQLCTLAARYGRLATLQWLVEDEQAGRPVSFLLMTAVCKEAAKYGRLDCLRYLHGERGWSWSDTTCRVAAEHNQLVCLMYAHENKCPWDREVIRLATLHGSRDCLQYARDHGCPE